MKAIRLPLMNYDELLKVVRPSNLLCPNAILDAIEEKYERKDADLNYRGVLSKSNSSSFSIVLPSLIKKQSTMLYRNDMWTYPIIVYIFDAM